MCPVRVLRQGSSRTEISVGGREDRKVVFLLYVENLRDVLFYFFVFPLTSFFFLSFFLFFFLLRKISPELTSMLVFFYFICGSLPQHG